VGGGRRGAGGKESDCTRGVRVRGGKGRGKAVPRDREWCREIVERGGGDARSRLPLMGQGACGGRVSRRSAGMWCWWRRGGLVSMVGVGWPLLERSSSLGFRDVLWLYWYGHSKTHLECRRMDSGRC